MRAAIHSPVLADRWQRLGEFLRYNTSLSPRHSELAVLATARHWDCQLEWILHVPHARKAGIEEEAIEHIRIGKVPALSDEVGAAVFSFAIELLARHDLGDATYNEVLSHFGEVATVELTALVGYYSMVAMTLNAHHVPVPQNMDTSGGLGEVSGELWAKG